MGLAGGGGAVPQGEEAGTRWKADLIFDCFFFFLLLSSCLWLKRNTGVCGLGGGAGKDSSEMGRKKIREVTRETRAKESPTTQADGLFKKT